MNQELYGICVLGEKKILLYDEKLILQDENICTHCSVTTSVFISKLLSSSLW